MNRKHLLSLFAVLDVAVCGAFVVYMPFSSDQNETHCEIKKDFSDATALSDKSCSLGDHNSCIELAKLYSTGRTVSYDAKKSFAYYEKACILGDAQTCIKVADRLHSNLKDKEAFKKAENII